MNEIIGRIARGVQKCRLMKYELAIRSCHRTVHFKRKTLKAQINANDVYLSAKKER
jgi:hypothetical protein